MYNPFLICLGSIYICLFLGCVSCSLRIRGHHPSSLPNLQPANPFASPERLRDENGQMFSSTTAGSPISHTSSIPSFTMSRAVPSCGDESIRLHHSMTLILVFMQFTTNPSTAISFARS